MHELEAKFLATDGTRPEDVLRRLQESLAGAGYRIQPKGRRSFTDCYFDSVDHQLRAAGWSYRERQDEQGRRVALKEINRSRAAIFDREEVEQPLGREERLVSLGRGPVTDRLSNLLHPDADVVPLFSVTNDRAAYSLSHPDHPQGLVEMALDEARIQTHDPVQFQELALELKNGSHELLANILAAVELEPDLLEARLSAFERGMMAAGFALDRRRGLKPKPLDRHARWLDLAVIQLKAELYRIKLYEPYAWEGLHPEGVHRMRLAIRRAHAVLRAFADVLPDAQTAALAPRLRRMSMMLGRLRQLDVHVAHLTSYGQIIERSYRAALEHYRAHLRRLQRDAHRALLAALGGQDYPEMLSAFRTLLTAAASAGNATTPRVEDRAAESLQPVLDQLNRRGGAIDDRSPDRALHRLRVVVERLRIQLEFLQPIYRRDVEPALAAAQRLGERVGAHQDACVAAARLSRFHDAHAAGDRERSAVRHLIRLEKRRAHRHRARFAGDWRQFGEATADLPERLRPL